MDDMGWTVYDDSVERVSHEVPPELIASQQEEHEAHPTHRILDDFYLLATTSVENISSTCQHLGCSVGQPRKTTVCQSPNRGRRGSR